MRGIVKDPTVTALATELPLMEPIIPLAITATFAGPPEDHPASAMAMSIFMIHALGDIWSPEIVGRLSDHLGSLRQAVLLLPGALAVGAGLWFGLALLLLRRPAAAGWGPPALPTTGS